MSLHKKGKNGVLFGDVDKSTDSDLVEISGKRKSQWIRPVNQYGHLRKCP